jgi:hypothetical protein
MPRHGKGSKQKVAAAKGQTYGDRVAQEEAQRVVPLPSMPVMRPGQSGPLTRPTERVREPVTAGAPIGPGPGPGSGLPAPQGRRGPLVSQRLLAALPLLEEMAAVPGASREVVRLVNRLRVDSARSPQIQPI